MSYQDRAALYNRGRSTARARAAYTNALLKSQYSHEYDLLEGIIGANEDLIAEEQKAIGLWGTAGNILGMLLGGPVGAYIGRTAGSFFADAYYDDPEMAISDIAKFKLLRNKARDYRGDMLDYEDMKWDKFATDAVIGAFQTYMSAGGFDPQKGFIAPGDIKSWRTYGNVDYEGNMLQSMFQSKVAEPFEALPADFTPGYQDPYQFGTALNDPTTDYGIRMAQYPYLQESSLSELDIFPTKLQYASDPRYAAVLQHATDDATFAFLTETEGSDILFDAWEMGFK